MTLHFEDFAVGESAAYGDYAVTADEIIAMTEMELVAGPSVREMV